MRALVIGVVLLTATAASVAARPVVGTRSDLPPTRFSFAEPPSAAMRGPAFVAMLPAIRTEAERLLRDYGIKDMTITQDLQFGLASIAVIEGRHADADRWIGSYRASQTKPQAQAIGGLVLDLASATLGTADGGCSAAAARFDERLAGIDPVLVRDSVLASYSAIQIASEPFFAGTAVGVLDPVVRERGSLDLMQALQLAYFRAASDRVPACRPVLAKAARAWIDNPANAAVDIWAGRQPADAALANAKPVVVAVWDRGFDTTLFPGQIAFDPAEPLDGHDNDGNGIVDDFGGPTYDVRLRPRQGVMAPPTRWLQARLAAQMAYDKGELDLRYGLDTAEAAMFAEFSRTAGVDAQGEEFLGFLENAGRVHGTACASEIADGAPYVRLYNVAALPWGRDEKREAIAYDEETIARWAGAIDRLAGRLKSAGVRVVSMSWGLTADEVTQELLEHNLEADPARAKVRGIAMQKTIGSALERLMRASPNVLFVVAAGNSNQADAVQADAAQQLNLPNLIIVGATGANGKPTSFTVTGPSVAVYAQGEAVPLRWPGDLPVRMSGTSMAAPLVARAAAQMFAVNPALTAARARQGLVETATAGEVRLLHPAAAVAWAQGR